MQRAFEKKQLFLGHSVLSFSTVQHQIPEDIQTPPNMMLLFHAGSWDKVGNKKGARPQTCRFTLQLTDFR